MWFGEPSKGGAGLAAAINAGLQKPVQLGDTLLVVARVKSCVAAAEEVTKARSSLQEVGVELNGPANATSLHIRQAVAGSSGESLEEKVLFEYLACDNNASGRKQPSFAAALSASSEKKQIAVIVHDGRSVVTTFRKDTGVECFPEAVRDEDESVNDTLRRVVERELGPALLKGGDADLFTKSAILLPRFSRIMRRALDNAQFVCTIGNSSYYSCYLEPTEALRAASEKVCSVQPEIAPALDTHYSAFAAARQTVNAFRQTKTDKKGNGGTSIRPFD